MKRKPFLILSACMIIGLMIIPVGGAEKYRIAVLPFDDGSIQERWWDKSWEIGKGVSDELITALLGTDKFRVVEREQIDKVLQEQDFGAGGRVDPQSVAEIGKILGVKYLVIGRVTEFTFKSSGGGAIGRKGIGLGLKTVTARVAIDARLVDASTAEILAGVKGLGEKKQTNLGLVCDWNLIHFGSDEFRQTNLGIALRDAVTQLANGLAEKAYGSAAPAPLTGLIAYVSGSKVYINLGSSDGVKPGMVFVVYHVLDLVKDPKTGEVIDEIAEPVAEISVAEVKERASICTVLTRLSTKYEISMQDKVEQK